MYTVPDIFDRLFRDFPDENLESAIRKDAAIIHNKHVENSIVKLQGPSDAKLSKLEEKAVKIFKIDVTTETQEEKHNDREEGYAARIRQEVDEKTRRNQKELTTIHVASNNNTCERLFSGTKKCDDGSEEVYGPNDILEMVTMLDENSDL